jgi:chromosome segregation ATPase
VFHLDRDKSDLSSQLVQLQSVSHSEHEASLAREQDLLEKVADMTVTVADLTSSNTVLKSEVVDLRVCLQSADRELSEAKTTRKQDSLKHNSKLMECMQKIGELEQVVATNVADLERQTEDLQNMQDEVETGREELTFKSHRINDLEQALRQEKEHSTSLTAEMQCVLEKLTREVEKNTQLSSELQEGENGKQQELVKALDENAMLSSRVTQLETDMKRQLHEYQRQTSDAQTTITSLHNRQMADREAIGSLMGQLQELRSSRATDEARVGSLRRELQDTSQELRESLSRNNRQAAKVESLEAQIKNMALDHERELKKKDSEREIVVEELEHISEQYQQLSSTFAAQSGELSLVERETRETRESLALRETELATLRQKKERRASVSKAQSFDEMKTLLEQSDEEKDRLRSELSKAVAMLGDYEQAREEKDMEIRRLQEELKNRDAQVGELNQLTANLATVQSQLEEQRRLEARLRQEMQGQSEEQVRLQRAYQTAVETRDSVLRERAGLQRALEEATSSVASLSDQLGRYKAIEQRLFDETQSYQSQLEALREEKSKLAKECANLAKENAAISGHQNLRQKIHYHATTKLENSRLKEEVMVLEIRLRVKTTELANLQKKVTHLLTEPPTTHTPKSSPSSSSSSFTTPSIGPHHLNNTSLLKENIVPK